MGKQKPKLREGDQVICAYAQPAAGPGWANQPLWVIVQGADRTLRRECLQPEEQSESLRLIYRTSAEIHGLLLHGVENSFSMKRLPA